MKKLAILFFGLFALSTSAQAITWDFYQEGERSEQGYGTFETGVTDGNPMDTGITITATHVIAGVTSAASPYFDGDAPDGSGLEGGLGVCSIYNGPDSTTGECGSDDNQSLIEEETIHMAFDATTRILGMVLTGDHSAIRDDTVLNISSNLLGADLAFNIGSDLPTDIVAGPRFLSLLALDFYANDMSYWITDRFGRETGAKIYLAALIGTVPVPAAVWLFGTAMLGLFGLRRKTKADALAA